MAVGTTIACCYQDSFETSSGCGWLPDSACPMSHHIRKTCTHNPMWNMHLKRRSLPLPKVRWRTACFTLEEFTEISRLFEAEFIGNVGDEAALFTQ